MTSLKELQSPQQSEMGVNPPYDQKLALISKFISEISECCWNFARTQSKSLCCLQILLSLLKDWYVNVSPSHNGRDRSESITTLRTGWNCDHGRPTLRVQSRVAPSVQPPSLCVNQAISDTFSRSSIFHLWWVINGRFAVTNEIYCRLLLGSGRMKRKLVYLMKVPKSYNTTKAASVAYSEKLDRIWPQSGSVLSKCLPSAQFTLLHERSVDRGKRLSNIGTLREELMLLR